jgi:hypothetical protein
MSIGTRRQIRRGAFHSLDDLQTAITRYIDAHNSDSRPFVLTTSAKAINLRKTRQDPCTFSLSQCTRCLHTRKSGPIRRHRETTLLLCVRA